MSDAARIVHTARTRTSGGREHGVSRSYDGQLDLRMATQGSDHLGTSPEHLLAAAWSTCFETGIRLAAQRRRIAAPESIVINAEVDLCAGASGHFLRARLSISMPDVDRDLAQALVDEAHANCPYSKATRGNIDVTISLAGGP
jgi:osmotically inducible protein OsmC